MMHKEHAFMFVKSQNFYLIIRTFFCLLYSRIHFNTGKCSDKKTKQKQNI